jgi:Ca-activated chloride channel family protein
VKLIAKLDRRLVPAGANTQTERFLRVQVQADERSGPTDRLPLNLALVIDRSGSMAGTKLEKAKEAAIFCMKNLTSGDRAAVVAYDDEVRVVAPSRALTPETKNRIIADIRGIDSGGSTNLAGGWLTGAQEAANHMHEANYLSRAILLSDGLANVGITDVGELARHADELRKRGVSTTTMGIGADFSEELMEKLAVKGGGHFYYIEDGKQIPDFLHRELGEVLSTTVRKVTLELDAPEGIEVTLLNNFEVERTGTRHSVRIDDMIAGEVRSVVFKLGVRPGTEGTALPFFLKLTYLDVESGETRTVHSSEAVLTYASHGECDAERPNNDVLEEAALLQAAIAREEALKYDAAGDYATGAATLAQTANYLRAIAPASPTVMAEATTLVTDSQQAASGFGARKRKEMHYDQNARRQSRKK